MTRTIRIHEFGGPNWKPNPGIGVADPKNRAGDRVSFGNQDLQITFSRLGKTKNCNRTGFDLRFHRDSLATFAVKEPESA